MKKSILSLLICTAFLISTAAPSFAHYRNYGHWHHGWHHGYDAGDILLPLGFGLITGAIIAGSVAQAPPPTTVVYRQVPPPVVVSPPVQYYPSTPPPVEELVINRVSITTGLLNIRSGPGLETPVISQVRRGEVLDVIGASPGWLYIRTASGLHGWVMKKYTAVRTTPAG